MQKLKKQRLLYAPRCLLWTVVGAFFGTKPQNALDTYTVCDDKEYYSETTYYLTEAAYLNQGQNGISRNS